MAAMKITLWFLVSVLDLGASSQVLGATYHQETAFSFGFRHTDEAAGTMLPGLRQKALQLLSYVVYIQPEDDFAIPPGGNQPPTPFTTILIRAVIWLAISGVAGLCFKTYVKMPDADSSLENKAKLTQWSSGPFDCFSDMSICCWSCCCPAIRWAGTMEMVGLMSFWGAFAFFVSVQVVQMISLVAVIAGLALTLVLTYFRNQLRVAFEMQGANEACTMCGDCVFVTCCMCCAISQEARHVQLAAEANHEVVASQRSILEEAPAQAV